MEEKYIIKCKKLTLAYGGEVVLRDLSFCVPWGEILLISGENGSGKSTLVKALLGLLKPVSGDISYADGVRESVGYLPQMTEISRDFPATVKEVVFSGFAGRLRHGMFLPKGADAEAREAMRLTGTEAIAGKCYNELSGGQQQRTLLARALCAAREVLILDEPTNGLDPASAADMYSIITTLKREHGITVIMVSHDLETSVTLADRVLHLCCDGAFCCPASEYGEQLSVAHADGGGVLPHACGSGHEHHEEDKK